MRRVILSLCVLALLAVPSRLATASPPEASDGTGPLDSAADLDAAMHFESLIPEFTFGGMVVPLMYDKWPHIDAGAEPWRMDGEGDSGNYTGVYLAGESWRYSQAKAELTKLGVDPLSTGTSSNAAVTFWREQRDEALARSSEIVDYYHVLVNIAETWTTALDPMIINDDYEYDELGYIDFGGGVVPGEKGLLMRTCTPDDPERPVGDVRINYADTPFIQGPFQYQGRTWWCIQGTSRDSYAGTLFGLGVALDYLGKGNTTIRNTIAKDLMAMTDYAVKYLWNQPRPHGIVANPALGHNDLNGPISPLFLQVPLHRLHLLATARRAAELTNNTTAKLKYDALYAAEVAASVKSGALALSMVPDTATPHDAYYKYQLHLMSFFNVIRLEKDPLIREDLMAAMGVLDATISDDGNAFFEAITYALTGEQQRLDEAVDLHRQWLDYHAFHEETARRGVTPFLHTPRCDITGPVPPDAPIEEQPLECVTKDRVDMIVVSPTGEETVVPFNPGTLEDRRALHPLPVGVRRLADFMWQKDPTIIGGNHDTPWRGPSIDFLSTYWMLRYYSEVEVPATEHPLPEWAGPRFF